MFANLMLLDFYKGVVGIREIWRIQAYILQQNRKCERFIIVETA